jgi:hypothetical protein
LSALYGEIISQIEREQIADLIKAALEFVRLYGQSESDGRRELHSINGAMSPGSEKKRLDIMTRLRRIIGG